VFQLDRVLDRERGRLTDQHRVGRRGRLEAGSRVHRVAGHPSLIRASVRVDHLAGVDPDAQAQLTRDEPESGAEALDAVHEGEAGPDGALGVVVTRARDAEHGHRGVADELLEDPAVALDRVAYRAEVRVLDGRDVLGIKPL